jgi:hypothetical protein
MFSSAEEMPMSTSLCLRQCRPQVIASIVSDYVAGARDGLAMARRYDALSALPASHLARLGLTRADISRVVATDAPRRPPVEWGPGSRGGLREAAE